MNTNDLFVPTYGRKGAPMISGKGSQDAAATEPMAARASAILGAG